MLKLHLPVGRRRAFLLYKQIFVYSFLYASAVRANQLLKGGLWFARIQIFDP
jgi:hypothetical protein